MIKDPPQLAMIVILEQHFGFASSCDGALLIAMNEDVISMIS